MQIPLATPMPKQLGEVTLNAHSFEETFLNTFVKSFLMLFKIN